MEIGALVIDRWGDEGGTRGSANPRLPLWPVLGKSILERWLEMVRGFGIELISVVDQDAQQRKQAQTMLEWAKTGVEQILTIVLGPYAEVNVPDVMRFHAEKQRQITKVFDRHGPLGISLFDRRHILNNNVSANRDYEHSGGPSSSRYDFQGYVARLSSSVNYRQLVEDALLGRCGIRPAGMQISENVWIAAAARVSGSARIFAPCYIGPGTKIKAGVVLRGCSSVEGNCEVDLGTTLDHSSVLPNTYVASGLYLRQSVVDGTKLQHLARGIAVDLGDARLSARISPRKKHNPRAENLPSQPELAPSAAKV